MIGGKGVLEVVLGLGWEEKLHGKGICILRGLVRLGFYQS